MNRTLLTGIVVGLLAGFIIGYFTGTSHSAEQPAPIAPAVQMAPPGMPVAAPPGMGGPAGLPGAPPAAPSVEAQARIFGAEQVVAREPGNLQAWVALGNDYFDTHQSQKAINAYTKALELDPKNPDILTDQGIMYRELMAFDKAVANFEKAGKLDPKHVQSLFNLGIVYAMDLKAPDKAAKAWNRVIEIDPAGPQAAKARLALENLRAHRPIQ